jgi:putative cardiolipin synthase
MSAGKITLRYGISATRPGSRETQPIRWFLAPSAIPGATGIGYLVICLLLLAVTGCSTLSDNIEKTPSHAMTDTQGTSLGLVLASDLAGHSGHSGFYPLSTGLEAFLARIALIEVAERSLDVQYYIWHADDTGLIMMQRILAAADRGVWVRILLDDLDTAGKDPAIGTLDTHPNIEIRLFNPFNYRKLRILDFATGLSRVNRRMHNKSLSADNQVTIVGGRNVGNEYFDAAGETVFTDLDVLSVGPIVAEVSKAFDRYWNSDWAVPAKVYANEPASIETLHHLRSRLEAYLDEHTDNNYVQSLKRTVLSQRIGEGSLPFSWGDAELIYDAPEKIESEKVSAKTHVGPRLKEIVDRTREELIIVSPYFVPGDALVDYCRELVNRGVRVRILTNALASSDVALVHAGYMRYRKDLLRNGVELFEFKPVPVETPMKRKSPGFGSSGSSSLHAKVFGIDRQELFVGSFNLDPRSVSLNTEMGVWFKNAQLGRQLGETFHENISQVAYRLSLEGAELRWHALEAGSPVVYQHEPETSWWQRFKTRLLSLIVIERLL